MKKAVIQRDGRQHVKRANERLETPCEESSHTARLEIACEESSLTERLETACEQRLETACEENSHTERQETTCEESSHTKGLETMPRDWRQYVKKPERPNEDMRSKS